MTTGLYLLRCYEAGIHLDDLDKLDIGLIYDIFVEKSNDSFEYAVKASQEDMDRW